MVPAHAEQLHADARGGLAKPEPQNRAHHVGWGDENKQAFPKSNKFLDEGKERQATPTQKTQTQKQAKQGRGKANNQKRAKPGKTKIKKITTTI